MSRILRSVASLALAAGGIAAGEAREPGPDPGTEARKLFARQCVSCHGPRRQDGGLRLDSRARALLGGDHGPAVVPGRGEDGELLRRLTSDDPKRRMPLGGKALSGSEIAAIRRWIEAGATWPEEAASADSAGDHWAFRPVRRPRVPAARGARTVQPIDAFVRARLEAAGLAPSPEAEPRVLLRRIYLDLLGLPPPAGEAEALSRGFAPGEYERLVDRLLASPHFGERWGRHWLDLARFGESDGYENDRLRPEAWRFRDWVIDAANRDLPFDQFTVEQLAGDLLPNPTPAQRIAAGFHSHTLWNSAASADKEEFRTLAVKDRVDTTGAAWMGLTVGCAKCHSHKYDPLSQREYYQLYAFFNPVDTVEVPIPGGRAQSLRAVERKSFVHRRGNFLDPGDEVRPGTPGFLPPLRPRGEVPDRLDLARWLVSEQHPLTSRVAVDQMWRHLFGESLIPTPENLGTSGRPPTHPELLDWLASEFVRLKWSRKALLRTILLSETYRQASRRREEAAAGDPQNELLGRQNRFRVEAETLYDLALASTGLLDRKLGGPSIVPAFPEGILEQRFTNEALKLPTAERYRRGVYIHIQRTLSHPLLAGFDAPDGNQACVRRDRSATPLQALALLNDPTFAECARALGKRLRTEADDTGGRLRRGFLLCLGRLPSAEEQAVLTDLTAEYHRQGLGEEATWNGIGRVLLNLDEFSTRE